MNPFDLARDDTYIFVVQPPCDFPILLKSFSSIAPITC